MFKKEIIITHKEWMKYKYSYKDYNHKDKDCYKMAIFGLALTNILITNPVFLVDVTTCIGRIDSFGNTLLRVLRVIGYWLCLLGSISDTIKGITSHKGTNELSKIFIKYIIIFSSLYFMKDIFDMIKEAFS